MKVRSWYPRVQVAASVMLLAAGLATAQTLPTEIPQGSYVAGASGPQLQTFAQDDPRWVLGVLEAGKRGDGGSIHAAIATFSDPLWRKIALWALADGAPESMNWTEADAARRDLANWPRPLRRQIAAEKLLDRSNMPPAAMIAWFGATDPVTAQGAMALASALRANGQREAGAEVIRRVWRGMVFDEDTQETLLARFSDALTTADHVAREDMLLYGAQGTAALDVMRLIPADQQALARARMAVRRGDPQAQSLIDALPFNDQTSPGLTYERVLILRDRGDTSGALALLGYVPAALPNPAAEKLWKHGSLVVAALKAGDNAGAYRAAAHSGLTSGADAAEAQFYAGWIALSRLKDARAADDHFALLQSIGKSPLTQSRALYWRGRAAEAAGDPVAAQLYYGQAARYYTTFYGQLAATRGGAGTIVLGQDPRISDADRARFEAREPVRAARLIFGLGAKATFKAFVVDLSEMLPSASDEAMLVDFARGLGDQELSMRVVRNAAKRDFILPERGYPIRNVTLGADAAETPFVLGITRQESSFDPMARSGAGARGMMQLMPATAEGVARRSGLGYGDLNDPDYNMKLGSTYLGGLVGQFSGSYVMAAAAYNAGPGRPNQWTGLCGDPRSSATDPLDFIECIPFSETRDYVMRVLEATQVYRARLGGGSAPITLAADLKRGAYGYHAQSAVPAAANGQLATTP